jgi:uncharacterized protein
MDLFLRPEDLAVCQLPPDAGWPTPPPDESLFSATRTRSELSVVCRQDAAPGHARTELGWRALTVVGPLDFSMIGVIAALTTPVAAADVVVFVVSTFDTDHVLVKSDDLERAIAALRLSGHTVTLHPSG